MRPPVRAEIVGSLLKPPRLAALREELAAGRGDPSELAAAEDEAVLGAIVLQESAGVDVITDGEMRRPAWADTIFHLDGLEARGGRRSYPNSARNALPAAPAPTVVARISPRADVPLGAEYAFLRAHAGRRTKFTMAAPSYHRRYWSDELSTAAYPSCEDYLEEVRDWQASVARRLSAEGCDYIQLDAPNYGSLCDPDTRAYHEALGHRLADQVAFDAELDSSVFDGLTGVTRALHICRGNMAGAAWHSTGGYQVLADDLFPNLDVDVVLLEYDSDRAGDFGPIAKVRRGTVAVLGLVTTKSGELEDPSLLRARVAEAATIRDLDELALSTQCGFSSQANAPMSEDAERAKLALVADVAHEVWGDP